MPITVKIKQVTGGGQPLEVLAEPENTILELKEKVAEKVEAEAGAIKLIYRGQILKDPQTVESYGIQNEHVVHCVVSKAQGGSARAPATGSAASATGGTPSTSAARPPAAAVDPLAQAMGGLNVGVPGTQADMMQQVMQSPMAQALLRNPELLRSMLQANPAVRQMIEANPEVGRMLNDPDTLRQMSQVMSNPALMREQIRNMDRAMSNIESMPGGFNALRQFHSTLQPLEDAANESQAGAAADNPFAALFQPAGSGAGAGAPGSGGAQQPAGAPNEAPLPNPWAAAGGGGGGAAGAAAAPGLGFGGLGGMNPAAMQQMLSNPEMQAAMQQLMADPGMQQFMQQQMASMLSTPEGQAQMQAMLEANPMYQSAAAANPALAEQMRSMMTDPQRLQAMFDPRTQHAMQQMMQAMQELQSAGLFPDMPTGLGGAGLGSAPGAAGGAAGGMPDFGALMGMLGGGAGGLGGLGVPAAPANPEEAYAAQLQQLQDMGFYDREANIRALVAAGGNVNVAVERLLSSM